MHVHMYMHGCLLHDKKLIKLAIKLDSTPAVESDGCSSSSLEDNCSIA